MTLNSNNNKIAVIGAMAQEVEILIESMINLQTIEIAGVQIYSGIIADQEVLVLQSGIGKVNATIATTLVIERFTPNTIINTGSAGGISNLLTVGDVVIGTSVTHHDVDVTAFGYKIGQMAQMPEKYESNKDLIKLITVASKSFGEAQVHLGQIVSGDQFVSNANQFETIKNHFPNALAVEMEAAAIAQTCYQFKVPFVVVRAISDLADEQASISFDEFIKQAGKKSAEMVIQTIRLLKTDNLLL